MGFEQCNAKASSANLGTSPVTFTPGFNASRTADQTTFTTNGTQILTVSVTPKEPLLPEGIDIGVNLPENQYVNATIESVTAPDGAPLNTYSISPERVT